MSKKWTYALTMVALGVVVFNNVVQTATIIHSNNDLITGLIIALIGSVVYGMVNIK